MVRSITNAKTKLWTVIDALVFAVCVYLFLVSSQQPIVLFVITLVILYRIKDRSYTITMTGNEIHISNRFTTTKATFAFTHIQKFAFTEQTFFGPRLLLISNDIVVAKIRYENYSNFQEILDVLKNGIEAKP